MRKILIIDDEEDIRLLIQGILEDEGYAVSGASDSTQGYDLIRSEKPDLIIQDIWLQGSPDDGIKMLQTVKAEHPHLPFLMISGHGTIETAVASIKLGAYDFIEKPFKSDRLLLMINRALENADLKQQNTALKLEARHKIHAMAQCLPEPVLHALDKCAKTNSRVFITGEVGTGKNIAAQYLHQNTLQAQNPFIRIDCQACDFEKETGRIEEGATIFLDEVQSLSLEGQNKLLKFLQEGQKNVRVISGCSVDIESMVQRAQFREELFYRLNVVPLHIPPLRKRKAEFKNILEKSSSLQFSDMAMAKFLSYRWPGNLKQLHNVLEWISIMHGQSEEPVCLDQLPPEFDPATALHKEPDDLLDMRNAIITLGLREARERFERYYLLTQLNKFDGNISKTAEFIGMERSALHRKLKSLEVFSDDKHDAA